MGAIKKQALASKDVGPAEIGQAAAAVAAAAMRRAGWGRAVLIWRALPPARRSSAIAPDITEALATLTPVTQLPDTRP